MGTLKRLFGTKQFWFSFVAACVPAFILEPLAEQWLGPNSEGSHSSIFDVHYLYRKRVTGGWRGAPIARYTAIVEIREGREPSWAGLTSVCKQRGFIAALIRAIDKARPNAIVIDKYFEEKTCPVTSEGTQSLLKAVNEISRNTAIVVGRTEKPIGTPDRVVWAPSVSFTPGKDGKIVEADITLDQDTRQVPLEWEVWDDAAAKAGEYKYSLALQGALARESGLLEEQPRLKKLIQRHEDPYTSFIEEKPIPTVSANTLLFGDRIVPEQGWQHSIIDHPDEASKAKLRGKIVVIGEYRSDIDQHTTEMGEVPGYVLQANYIESILDQRYFEPAYWLWNVIAGLLIFSLFHIVLIACEELLGQKSKIIFVACSLGAIAITLLLAYGALLLVVVFSGWYVDPINVSATAIWVLILHGLFYGVGDVHRAHAAAVASAEGGIP